LIPSVVVNGWHTLPIIMHIYTSASSSASIGEETPGWGSSPFLLIWALIVSLDM
jgi:hypothetical protein